MLSGITSIAALNIREFYDLYLNEIIDKSGDSYNAKAQDDVEIINKLYKYINLNQMITNISANYIYATFIGIRNGIMLIGAFFIIIVGKVGIDKFANVKYVKKILATITNLANAGLFEKLINSAGYLFILLGSIGMILFIIKFPVSTRIKDHELTPERLFSLNGYQLWRLSWLLIIFGTISHLSLIWVF